MLEPTSILVGFLPVYAKNTLMMGTPDFSAAIDLARKRLEAELPGHLHYHNVYHTFGEVLPASMKLASQITLPEMEIRLLRVAAAYHDIGWIVQGQGHEAISVDICQQVLPNFGFFETQLEAIAGMIMATRLPQSPQNTVEQILADADMFTLGSEEFWSRNNDLRDEMEALSFHVPDRVWYESQLEFLEEHSYHTSIARKMLEPIKQHNIEQLRRYLAQDGQSSETWMFPPPNQ